ncbi:MAG: sulfatase-like hydrolase/transferase [Sneathiella sp.]|uniref:sulfatase-like hydrolase/transferase n=1 Tax=Sneathiella sp. TaxID=1964365 RepID=UPI003001109E
MIITKDNSNQFSRRDLLKTTGLVALTAGVSSTMTGTSSAQAASQVASGAKHEGPYNILLIVTDQERHMSADELPIGYRLPGHERMAKNGVVFENHQVASCVCTPSRAVMYTGQHIQNNGMFDNTNFPWSGSMSTDIDTVGDLLRKEGYYTAYKGKWHLTEEFETANNLNAPTRILSAEMEEYGFSDYFGIGDIIAHTEGGYLHDDVISAMSRSWLRGTGEKLREEKKPWFMAVNMVNPHDVMYYNTDKPDQSDQSKQALLQINREPQNAGFQTNWNPAIPASHSQAVDGTGRPKAHLDYRNSRGVMVGVVPNEEERWRRLNNYYFNCIQDVDKNIVEILDEMDDLGITDNTIIIFTADHGELGGAHGLNGKGATAYREQNNVPFTIVHPAYKGGKRCRAVTSHVDLATTLISMAGGDPSTAKDLPGKDITTLLENPEAAKVDSLRAGALYNYNMFAYVDQDFFGKIGKYFADGGKAEDIANQGFRPNLKKRGAIRTIHDGNYKFSRYYSPLEHHTPKTMEQLFAQNDVELFDLKNDPLEINNLAIDPKKNADLIMLMNDKLNLLIEIEVGEDTGTMLPKIDGIDWQLPASIKQLRM